MSAREDVLQQAMALSPEDRVFLADQLEQSLTTGGFADPEVASAWLDEIELRIAAYDRGELQAVGVDASLARIRAKLAERQARKA